MSMRILWVLYKIVTWMWLWDVQNVLGGGLVSDDDTIQGDM